MSDEIGLKQAYKVMAKASGIKDGDEVKILRVFEDGEMECNLYFKESMSSLVGTTSMVRDVDYSDGSMLLENGRFWWPFFCLELVKKGKPRIKAGGYVVEFNEDGESITVGCTTVDFDTVKAIYKKMKKLG